MLTRAGFLLIDAAFAPPRRHNQCAPPGPQTLDSATVTRRRDRLKAEARKQLAVLRYQRRQRRLVAAAWLRRAVATLRSVPFFPLRWLGAVGTLLIGVGGLGAGALPVMGNPWFNFPGGATMSRMLQTSSAVVFVGVGLLVTAWLLMAPHVGAFRGRASISTRSLVTTYLVWITPIVCTAPVFTQDIYSYFAQGSILRQGLDPYAAGPVEILGSDHPLARSVPFIWAHSPSPYGPVALGINAAISGLSNDAVLSGVIAHRLVGITAMLAGAWATTKLARRCGVEPVAALWLGIVNPLTILHLVGGIHNEGLMLGLILVGMELGLRGVDELGGRAASAKGWAEFLASGVLLACAGLVKVTGFVGLGFTGMAYARALRRRRGVAVSLLAAGAVQTAVLAATAAAASLASGAGFGWLHSQGGAAQIRSAYSLTTNVGVAAGEAGMRLGLGDHTDAMLTVTRGAGIAVAGLFILRMLWETYAGRIHPLGGLGMGSLVLVVLFPVIQPWYVLWAILPLAAWKSTRASNRALRGAVVAISVLFSFVVLPRGLALPSETVATIYGLFAATYALFVLLAWGFFRLRARKITLTTHG